MRTTPNPSLSPKSPKKVSIKVEKTVILKRNGSGRSLADVKYKKLVEHMNEAVWVGDEKERTVYANPKFCELMGYSLEEMLGRLSYDFWTPESAKQVRSVNEGDRRQGVSSSYEGDLLTKSGKTIPVLLNGTPLPDGGTIGIMTDLTEIRKKEAEVETLLERLDISAAASKDGLWYGEIPRTIFDRDSDLRQYLWYSPRVYELLGCSDEELPNTVLGWMNLVHPEDLPRMARLAEARINKKTSFALEYRLRLKDGTYRWFSTKGDIMPGKDKSTFLIAGSFRDVHRRRTAEQDLLASKKLFNDLVASSPVATFMINTHRKIVYWNNSMEEITGLKYGDMIGTKDHWKPFYMKEKKMITDMMIEGMSHKQILKHYQHMDVEESSDKKGIVGSVYFTNFCGQKRWLRFMIKPMRDPQNRIVGAIETVEDITDRKRMSYELAGRTREFQTLNRVHSHTLMADPIQKVLNEIKKDVLFSCPERSLARSRITFDGKVYTNLKKGEEFVRPKIVEPIKVHGKKRGKIELGYIQKMANAFDPLMTQEKRLIGMVADSLGRHVRSREVIERYEKLVKKSTVGVYIVQDDVFQFVNPKFNKIFKFRAGEVMGRDFMDLINCKCHQKLMKSDKFSSQRCETRGIRKDGAEIDVEVVVQKIDYHGNIALLGTVQDVTKLKQTQQALQALNEDLQAKVEEKTRDLQKANNRLQSLNELKDEFIAVTSHELRSPLTSVKGYLSFLLDESLFKQVPDEAKDYLLRAYDNVEVLNNLMNNILDVSHIDTNRIELNRTPTDLLMLIQGVIRQLSYQAKKKGLTIHFENKLDGDLVLHLDSVRIQQVVRNILGNAIKYSPKRRNIWVQLERRGIGAEISFVDEGVGIPKSQIFNVFDKYHRAKNSHARFQSGAGLGLFIAKKIVELHDGMIWVESKVRKGTTIKIQLPIL